MAAVQGLLKWHDAYETDISMHGDRCTNICEAGQSLIDERNHHAGRGPPPVKYQDLRAQVLYRLEQYDKC